MLDSDQISVLELPYADRQLIIVTEDSLIDSVQKSEKEIFNNQFQKAERWTVIDFAWNKIAPTFGSHSSLPRKDVLKVWAKAKSNGMNILPVGRTVARSIDFPPGHPRSGVLYIGNPALPKSYSTMADFHRVTFEHKFCEAIYLLMSLGAVQLKAECIEGWSRDFSAKLSIPLGGAGQVPGGQLGKKSEGDAHILYEANFSGNAEPSIPSNLIWYPHEKTWQAIATGRMEYGLSDFSLNVTYKDDFGVNAGLRAAVAEFGFELGGQFETHVSTTWRLIGKFGKVPKKTKA